MISLLIALTAFAANPCPRAYVPGVKGNDFLENRLKESGLKLTRPEAWSELAESSSIEEETKGFDQVERDVFLRRLDELPLKELTRLYPTINANKLKAAKAKVNPCAH